ncbi:hypothetical protein BKA61DRAFT_666747 [Leptodontidium sp. MPI-SDFR-AT-0119]|nr:hypothetical protein BKA61DRAFT_666747 [Leptodontidium sp. MPI-SDFR-AT-0119]
MAELFGIVSGAIGIASAFTACVDCFELRLTRWGESVNIYDDLKLGRQDATAAEI